MLLLSADLDNLKDVNDSFGHHEGDLVLTEVSLLLRECFRESDIIARMGGDEFVVLMMERSDSDPDSLLSRLEKILARHNEQKRRAYKVSMSIGIARFEAGNVPSIGDMLVSADKLMYEQKRSRRKQQLAGIAGRDDPAGHSPEE